VLERLVRLVRPGRAVTSAERLAMRNAEPIETHAPDADVDDVGVPGPVTGFEGRALNGRQQGSGNGTGDPQGPGWSGWGGFGG
jgi:hypothetical protein